MSTPGLSHLSWLSTSPAAIEANQNSQTRTQTGQKKQEKPSIRAIKLRHSCLSGKRNTRPIRTGESHIHHAGSSKREKAPGRAAEDRSGESSTGRGGGQNAALVVSRGGFWITRRRIPQCRNAKHLNNTRNMVERAEPHTGPKPLLP